MHPCFEPRCHKHANPYRTASGLRNHFESMLKQASTGDRTGRRGEEARLHDLNRVFRELELQLSRDQTTVPSETQPRKPGGRNNFRGGQEGTSRRNITEQGRPRHAPPVNPRELRSRLKASTYFGNIHSYNINTNNLQEAEQQHGANGEELEDYYQDGVAEDFNNDESSNPDNDSDIDYEDDSIDPSKIMPPRSRAKAPSTTGGASSMDTSSHKLQISVVHELSPIGGLRLLDTAKYPTFHAISMAIVSSLPPSTRRPWRVKCLKIMLSTGGERRYDVYEDSEWKIVLDGVLAREPVSALVDVVAELEMHGK